MNSLWLYLATNMKMDKTYTCICEQVHLHLIQAHMISISHIFVIFLHRLKFLRYGDDKYLSKTPWPPVKAPLVTTLYPMFSRLFKIFTYDGYI